MMSKIKTVLLFLLLSTVTFSQGSVNVSQVDSPKDICKKLLSGALIVRLKTQIPAIEYLRKNDKNELAFKIEQEQRLVNQKIMQAFKSNFDYCPTYFVFSHFSDSIRSKKFDNVEFLNNVLEKDTSIVFNASFFLTAEFGRIEPDTASYTGEYYISRNGKNGTERRKSYSGGPNMGFQALLLKSDMFIQLRKPFPYYYRTIESIPFLRRSYARVVAVMNSRLHNLYSPE